MISERTTSIPMPRPDTCVTFDAVENPGLENALDELRFAGMRIRSYAALRDGLGAHAFEVQSRAVVGELDRDLVRDLPHRQRDFPGLGFAGLDSLRPRLDPVIERVAQEVLERADELLQHRAVELVWAPRISRLARLPRSRAVTRRMRYSRSDRLPNGTVRIENSCCWTSARQPPLRAQRRFCDIEVLEERLLHGRHVVDAFAERARELLEARVAVELERVESFLDPRPPARVATGSATRPGSRSRASARAGAARCR
jgi:hypothetical protein